MNAMPSNAEANEVIRLAQAVTEDRLDAESAARLDSLIRDNESARWIYAQYMNLYAGLAWDRTLATEDAPCRDGDYSAASEDFPRVFVGSDPLVRPVPDSLDPISQSPIFHSFGGWALSYVVATVVLAAMLLGAWAYKITHDEQQIIVEKTPQSVIQNGPREFVSVGRVTGMRECVWKDGNTSTIIGASVPLDRKYSLASGLMEITYSSGAKVILEGPCEYTADSEAGGYLRVGKLVARVEKRGERRGERGEKADGLVASATSAKPLAANPESRVPNPQPLFSVRTPTAVVTDLGTEFGVRVDDDGTTDSYVFKGSVEVRAVGGGADDRVTIGKNESAQVRLNEIGRAVVSRRAIPDAGNFTCRMPRTVSLDVFNTGVNLRERDKDPHWEIVARSDDPSFEPRQATVTAVQQPWFMPNDSPRYQWISLAGDMPRVPNDVVYTFRTRFELPEIEGQPCDSAVLRCGFMADNHVDAIRFNGRSIKVPEHGRESPFIRFNKFTVDDGFVPGENVLEFDVSNGMPDEAAKAVSAMALVVEIRGFAVYGGRAAEKHQQPENRPKGKEEANK